MKTKILHGMGWAVGLIVLIELASFLTASSLFFRIDYFFKGALLGLLLAAVASLYFHEAWIKGDRAQILCSAGIFLCSIASISLSFKFLMLGFLLHVIANFMYFQKYRRGFALSSASFDLVLFAYVYYVEFIDAAEKIAFY